MATLYIAEFPGLAETDQGDSIDQVPVAPTVEQTLAIGATSVASSAFQATTKVVEISTDSVCSIAWGTTPVATAANCRLAAGERIRRRVPYNATAGTFKVAVITNS